MEQRLIDANDLGIAKADIKIIGSKPYVDGWNFALQAVQNCSKTVDPETLPLVKELRENLKQQKWIQCGSSIMPDAEQEVRVICKTSTGYKYQCQAFYIPSGVYRDDSMYSWDWECMEYDEQRDDYMVNPGWYESIHNWDDYSAVKIADTVTHWTPLPQMPEEQND